MEAGDGHRDWLAAARSALKGDAPPAVCLPGFPDARPLAMPASWRVACTLDASDLGAVPAAISAAVRNGAEALTILGAGTRAAQRNASSFAGGGRTVHADGGEFAAALSGLGDVGVPVRLVIDGPAAARAAIAALSPVLRHRAAEATTTVCLDPITELATGGPAIVDWASRLDQAIALAGDLVTVSENGTAPPVQVAFIADGRPFHEAGADAGLELGCTLAAATVYARQLMTAGWPVERAFSAISFVVPVTADWLLSAAKLRALQKLWLGVQEVSTVPEPVGSAIHAETSWAMVAPAAPDTNILRAALAAFAAAIGGCRDLTVLPHTRTGIDTPHAARLALSIQHVLREEAMLRQSADPGAGSGAIENETAGLAEAAWAVARSLEGTRNGLPTLVADLSDGTLEARITSAASHRRPVRILGVTDYAIRPAPEPVGSSQLPFHLPARRWLAEQ